MTTTDRRQGLRTGLGLKAPCVVASTAALTLSGEQTIDGISVGSAQRVLVKDQADLKENGIYDVAATSWSRSKDFDGEGDAIPGTAAYVDRGTAGGGKFYAVNSSATSTSIIITTFVSSDADDKEWSLLSVALAGVSSFSQDTLLPLATQAAWQSSDGLNVRSATALVLSTDIGSSAVTTAKIADNGVTTAKIVDDAVTLAKMASGTAGNVITYDASGDPAAAVTGSSGQAFTSNGAGSAPTFQDLPLNITLASEQATTSGTAFDFTSISSDAVMIIINFNGVSLSGTDNLIVQIGDSGGLETAGYTSTSSTIANAGNTIASRTDSFVIRGGSAAGPMSGHMTLTKVGGNIWTSSHGLKRDTTAVMTGGGEKTLSGTLDRVRLTRNGANTFDAGSVSITVFTT